VIRRARVNRAPEVKEVSVRASGLEETYDGRTDKKKPKAVIRRWLGRGKLRAWEEA
jgi:hypothetical protein